MADRFSFSDLHDRARALRKRIALPEGEDPRTIRAAAWLAEHGVVKPILIGAEATVRRVASEEGVALGSIAIVDPATTERRQAYAQALFNKRKHKGLTYEGALELSGDVLYFGDLMVDAGDADGCVAGAAHPSPDVIRAAIQVLGVAADSALVSSFFLMVLPDGRPLTYADCGVNAAPSPDQLASIGIDAAANHRFLTGQEPKVAFLSFSTKGSADHPAVDAVRTATETAQARRPDLAIDGEFQFDAAFVPSVGERKAPGSAVAGVANVFVFPDLGAGNIGYKITQRVGGAEAYGPVLQGLRLPANDLSRGADWEDIANVATITAIQAGAAR
ncbi:phosphate acetyltransferase [Rubrivirga sp. IMCC43871]|uniref:phosphate acetyltransferase n=1 Tax=Rubrivirga sp. IMCC43871 TaxID=3391575 RepID=UPI00398FBF79